MLPTARPVLGTVQNIAYTGTAASSTAFGAYTTIIRIVSTTDCYYIVGQNSPTVTTTTGALLPALSVEYISVHPNDKISVIRLNTSGTLNAVEVSR